MEEMYPNLQIEKNGQNLPKKLTENHFVPTLMTYISLNIREATERVTYSENI